MENRRRSILSVNRLSSLCFLSPNVCCSYVDNFKLDFSRSSLIHMCKTTIDQQALALTKSVAVAAFEVSLFFCKLISAAIFIQ